MTDRDVLLELNRNINTLMVRTATTATTVAHIKETIRPIKGLVAWQNKWSGALISVSLVSTLLGLAGTTLGILLAINEFRP